MFSWLLLAGHAMVVEVEAAAMVAADQEVVSVRD
jgi:hypothetical protein